MVLFGAMVCQTVCTSGANLSTHSLVAVAVHPNLGVVSESHLDWHPLKLQLTCTFNYYYHLYAGNPTAPEAYKIACILTTIGFAVAMCLSQTRYQP